MKFTELTVKEFENFVQNPSLESHYFQVKENIATRIRWVSSSVIRCKRRRQ